MRREGGRDGGKGGRDEGREGGREREGGRVGGREGGKEGRREGGKEGRREGGKEGWRDGGGNPSEAGSPASYVIMTCYVIHHPSTSVTSCSGNTPGVVDSWCALFPYICMPGLVY